LRIQCEQTSQNRKLEIVVNWKAKLIDELATVDADDDCPQDNLDLSPELTYSIASNSKLECKNETNEDYNISKQNALISRFLLKETDNI